MLWLAFALALQEDTAAPFYKFKPETTWVYDKKEDEKARKMTLKVTKEEETKVTLESVEQRDDGTPKDPETLVWAVKDGILRFAEQRDEKTKDIMHAYKLGSKKGDTWKSPFVDVAEGEVTHLGTEEVTVPAGTYKDVVHTQMKVTVGLGGQKNEITIDAYLAPKAGMIKMEMVQDFAGEKKSSSLVLKEFKQP